VAVIAQKSRLLWFMLR